MLLIFYIVFSQLAVGGLALLLIIPKDLVGRGFYRLMGLIYLLVMIFARCANLAINGNSVSFSNFFLCMGGARFHFGACVLWIAPSVYGKSVVEAGFD